jgi:hypothetical protein
MTTDRTSSVVDRLWNRLEARYDTESSGCGCAADEADAEVIAASGLDGAAIVAYRRGDRTMGDLVARLDVDVDPATVDDLGDLAAAIENRLDRSADRDGRTEA